MNLPSCVFVFSWWQQLLRHLLSMHNFQLVGTEDIGNSLFRAVALQIYGNPEYHELLRAEFVKYLVNNLVPYRYELMLP